MRNHIIYNALALTALVAMSLPTTTQAQSSGNATVQITATVVQPLSVSTLRSLDFGPLFVGASKAVAPTASTAGQIDVRGQSGALLSVTFTMPNALTLTSTGATLPLSDWTFSTNILPSPTNFSGGTATPVTMALPNTAAAHMTINIGATATAGATQTAGDYTGSGQVAIAYTDY